MRWSQSRRKNRYAAMAALLGKRAGARPADLSQPPGPKHDRWRWNQLGPQTLPSRCTDAGRARHNGRDAFLAIHNVKERACTIRYSLIPIWLYCKGKVVWEMAGH